MGYEKNKGYDVVDVQNNSKFKGYDLIVFSKNKQDIKTIEVKGTEKEQNTIPLLYDTEVTRNKKLVATHLYIVKFDKVRKIPKELFIIPASEIAPEDLTEMRHFAVCSNFKTQRMNNYKVQLK